MTLEMWKEVLFLTPQPSSLFFRVLPSPSFSSSRSSSHPLFPAPCCVFFYEHFVHLYVQTLHHYDARAQMNWRALALAPGGCCSQAEANFWHPSIQAGRHRNAARFEFILIYSNVNVVFCLHILFWLLQLKYAICGFCSGFLLYLISI